VKKIYFPFIDILRGILALFVIYSHMVLEGPYSAFRFLGPYAVVCFFVISSFLLTILARAELEKIGSFSKWNFFRRRAIRIWPNYILYLLIVCAILIKIGEFNSHIRELIFSLLFLGNLKNSLYPIFSNSPGTEWFNVLWSLGVEEQFYLIFPFTFPLFYRLRVTSQIFITFTVSIISALIKWGVILKLKKHGAPLWPGVFFQSTTYLDVIMFGMLLGIYWTNIKCFFSIPKRQEVLNFLTYGTLVIWIILAKEFCAFPESAELRNIFFLPFTGLVSALLILNLSLLDNRRVKYPILIHIGKLSYGSYLFHMPVFFCFHLLGFFEKRSLLCFITVTLVTLLFSEGVRLYLEPKIKSRIANVFYGAGVRVSAQS